MLHFRSRHLVLVALATAAILPSISASRATPRPQTVAAIVIPCRALEVHTAQEPAITIVVFHQRDAADAVRLGNGLRQFSEKPVEFQTSDGLWRSATMVRLKSCFGRGLLVFPAGRVPLAEKDTFLLKLPSP